MYVLQARKQLWMPNKNELPQIRALWPIASLAMIKMHHLRKAYLRADQCCTSGELMRRPIERHLMAYTGFAHVHI